MKTSTSITAAALVAGLLTGAAQAELVVGLTSSQQLLSFDSVSPGTIFGTSPAISGLNPGDSIVDIDYYPVNGLLHGLGRSGVLYRINRMTGAATIDVTPQASLGTPQDMDFNPAADRLRIFSAGDANFRLTPSVNTAGSTGASAGLVSSDGTLTFPAGGNPNLVGAAYTNNFDGTATTTLYSIDADLDSLIIHSGAPQFSTLAVVGGLGVNVGQNVGFDISPSGATFVSSGNDLFSINLVTGALSPIGTIGSDLFVETIAVVPAPAGALALAGFAGLAARRRR